MKRIPIITATVCTVDETFGVHVFESWVDGAFVRIKPTKDATQDQVEVLKQSFLDAGAKAVRVMPIPAQDMVITKLPEVQALQVKPRELMRLLVGASSSTRKEAVLEVLDQIADEEGL